MTLSPPPRPVPLRAGGGATAPARLSSSLRAPIPCRHPGYRDSGVPLHLGLCGCAAEPLGLSNPTALRPSDPPTGAGRWRATLSYGAGRGGAPPPLRLRGASRYSILWVLFLCILWRGSWPLCSHGLDLRDLGPLSPPPGAI